MKNKTAFNLVKICVANVLFLVFAASCSKAPTGARAQVKNKQNTINPTTTQQAVAQASASDSNYTVATVSYPFETDNGYEVDVELQTPSGEYLPITTKHPLNSNLSQGTYNDTQRGLTVSLQATCSDSKCSKYLLLVTVVKNNQSLFQTFVISYDSDCRFWSGSASSTSGRMFSSLAEAASANTQIQPTNDIATCAQQ